jgi:hypothetical protein
VVRDYLEALGKRRYQEIASKLGIYPDEVQDAAENIGKRGRGGLELSNFKPGTSFRGDGSPTDEGCRSRSTTNCCRASASAMPTRTSDLYGDELEANICAKRCGRA